MTTEAAMEDAKMDAVAMVDVETEIPVCDHDDADAE